MFYRLKNSLIALATSVGLLLALGFTSVPAPTAPAPQQPTTSDLVRLAATVPVRDDGERAAWILTAVIAGVAVDVGMSQRRHNALDTHSNARKRASDRRLRMPFYSFAGQTSRSRES